MEGPPGVIKSTAELRLCFIEEPAVDAAVAPAHRLSPSQGVPICPLWVGG